MVNPRWRPTIANSRQTTKSKQKNTIKDLPTPTTIILFLVLLHKLTAFENWEELLKLADNFFKASISVLTVFFAICKSLFI